MKLHADMQLDSGNPRLGQLDEERISREDPARANAESTGQEILNLRRQMGPEEGALFDAQIQTEQLKILEIGRQALMLRAIPIGSLVLPKRQYHKKTHGKTDTRDLNGAKIAYKELEAREAKARQASVWAP